jgi:hypothetical protein
LLREFSPLPAAIAARALGQHPTGQLAVSYGDATHPKVQLHPIALAGCSPAMRNRSEEAATPGSPATLARFGNLSSLPSGQLLQNQPCTITGSVTSTPAVKALSLIPNYPSIKNRGTSVRKLWTMEVPCGWSRKKWRKFLVEAGAP